MRECEKTILFELVESSLGAISAARIVSSFKEALDIQLADDELDVRYNRFPLIHIVYRNISSAFWFRLYVNLENKELYVFFYKPSNTKMYLGDLYMQESCIAVLPLEKPKEALFKFLNNKFLFYLDDYYKDTIYSPDKAEYMSTMVGASEAEALLQIQNAKTVLEEKLLVSPLELLNSTRSGKDKTKYSPEADELIITRIIGLENEGGSFFYLVLGNYIWTVKKERFYNLKTGMLNSKILYFIEE